MGDFENVFCMFRKCFVLCLILLDSFVDVELERKGALLCMRLRLILFLGGGGERWFKKGGRGRWRGRNFL